MKLNLISFFLSLFLYKIIRWVISFIALVALSLYATFEIKKLEIESGYQFNIYDVMFYEFGLFMYLFLIIIPIYIYMVSDFFIDDRLDNYIYTRFIYKIEIWKYKILTLFLITGIYITLASLICILIGSLSFGISLEWSEGALHLNDIFYQEEFGYIGSNFLHWNPALAFLMLISLLILSLFSIGIAINVATIVSKKAIIAFVLGIIINFSTLITFKYDDKLNEIFLLPYQHIFLQFQNSSLNFLDTKSFVFSLIYWVLMIILLILLSQRVFLKTNYLFEVKNND